MGSNKSESMKDMERDASKRKLTIAHFMPSGIIGGAETATLRMTDSTKSQFRHIAFCLEDATLLRDLFEQQGIETATYTPPIPSLRHAVRYYKQSRAVARKIRTNGVDIVHLADMFAAYYNTLAAYLAHTKVICHIRLSHPKLALRNRLTLLPIHSYIFVSKDARNTFALSPLPDSKARVIYDAIEVCTADMTEDRDSARRELGVPPDCVLIGMIARVAAQKDYFTLASAAVEVLAKHPNVRFLIVGENSSPDSHRRHYEEVLQKLTELGIADAFIFTGHRSDVTRLIAAMDISVLCTHREGFGLAIAEAMALKKPVVATAVGGVLDIITDGKNAFLHQHGNSKELADKLKFLIENPEEAKKIGLAGYEHVRTSYSREKFVDEISRAYADLMRQ